MVAPIPLSVNSMPDRDGVRQDELSGNTITGGRLIYIHPDRDLDLGPFDITAESLTIMARTIMGNKVSTLNVKEISFVAKRVDYKGRIECQKLFKFPPDDLQNAELEKRSQ